MAVEISHDPKTGSWSLSYKRNLFVVLGIGLVLSGFTALSGPWWQNFLIALLGKVDIVVNDSYQWLIGGIQVLLGLALLLYKHFIADTHQEKISLDKKTLSSGKLNIQSVRQYLSDLVDDDSYKSSRHTDFVESFTHFKLPESSLQLKTSANLYEKYATSADELHNFVGRYFFVFPSGRLADNDYKYCLMPHYNMDRKMTSYDKKKEAEYNRLQIELQTKTAAARSALDQLTKHLKAQGHM